jgi:hypothetical protein
MLMPTACVEWPGIGDSTLDTLLQVLTLTRIDAVVELAVFENASPMRQRTCTSAAPPKANFVEAWHACFIVAYAIRVAVPVPLCSVHHDIVDATP